VLVAETPVFFQAFANDPFELDWQIGIQPHSGRWRPIQYRFEDYA
jgi:hypothetical protein